MLPIWKQALRDFWERGQAHAWSVRATGFLLVVQIAALVGIAIHQLDQVGLLEWEAWQQLTRSTLPLNKAGVIGLTFLPIAGLAALAAMGFFVLRPFGWLLAMLTQGTTLLVCLLIYWVPTWELDYLYLLMLFCIVMVLYLNSYDVRVAFNAAPQSAPPVGPLHE